MMSAVAPIWDGNETWLVVTGVVLWGAFPIVYATLLSAFYLPLLLMLAGLILRGVAFEFRYKTERWRWIWDVSFAGGSLVATFIQGMTVGALVEGLPIANGRYVGGEFGWLSPFAVLCGVGLCLGYALLGACWLVQQMRGRCPRRRLSADPLSVGRRCWSSWSSSSLTRWPSIFGSWTAGSSGRICSSSRRSASSRRSCSPRSVQRRSDGVPFYMVALIFVAAFGTLAISFWPYMIPFSITIDEAAAPHSSLAFMFWGAGLFVFPLMLLYTAVSYSVFRGKVSPTAEHY